MKTSLLLCASQKAFLWQRFSGKTRRTSASADLQIPPMCWPQMASTTSPASWHSNQIRVRTTAVCSGIKNWVRKLQLTFLLQVCITFTLCKPQKVYTHFVSYDPRLKFGSGKLHNIDALNNKQVSIIHNWACSQSFADHHISILE